MTTERQVEANRRNAAKSTGPRTAAGKRASRRNATKHGLLSAEAVVPTIERREDWERFRDELLESLQPMGALEGFLSERIVTTAWRLGRVVRIERDLMENEQRWSNLAAGGLPIATEQPRSEDGEETTIQLSVGPVRLPSVEKLADVVRYEAHLHRQFMQSLHELQRIQSRRLGTADSTPAAVDVVLSHDTAEHSSVP